MKTYKQIFKELKKKNEKSFIPFVVIGDPDYNTSLEIVRTIISSGADILELGFPFSDPLADGETIQKADIRALNSNIDTDKCFEFISDIRKFSDIPIGLLVYSNLIYQRGIDKFFKDAFETGVNSVLVADIPIEESNIIINSAKKYKLETVFLISPLTNEKRMKKILKKTSGFVYVVSRLGVTGAKSDLAFSTLNLIKRIRPLTKLPLCVGFGISKPEHAKTVSNNGADGVIVGSAIIKIIENNIENKNKMMFDIRNYVYEMKEVLK